MYVFSRCPRSLAAKTTTKTEKKGKEKKRKPYTSVYQYVPSMAIRVGEELVVEIKRHYKRRRTKEWPLSAASVQRCDGEGRVIRVVGWEGGREERKRTKAGGRIAHYRLSRFNLN